MADKKISELDSASLPLAGTEILPIVQGGVTKKVAVSEIGSGTTPTLDEVTTSAVGANVSSVPLVVDDGGGSQAEFGADLEIAGFPYIKSSLNDGKFIFQLPATTTNRIICEETDAFETTIVEGKFEDFTAIPYQGYSIDTDLTITDPSSGYYFIFVIDGTAIVGGVSYGVGTYLFRYYNGTTWFTKVLNATASPTVEGTTKLYDSLGTGTDGAVNRTVVTEEINSKISKHVGATYTTNAIQTVTQSEYDAIGTPDANTLYFII
jgi:hypothetical protein